MKNLLFIVCVFFCGTVAAESSGVVERGSYNNRADVVAFMQRVSANNDIPMQEIHSLLAQGNRVDRIIELISKPAEGKPWHEYRKIFLTQSRIDKGVVFWEKNQQILQRAEREFGVPAEIIVAILGVETYYGTRMGTFPVLDALMTLGFDYPKRGAFFRRELEQFILLVRSENLNAFDLVGSYAGAMGMGQFISSSYQHYAVDYNGDGQRDLWTSYEDGIGSVANYFKVHGWETGEPIIDKASVRGSKYKSLDADKLKPGYSVAKLNASGIKVLGTAKENEKFSLHILEGKKAPEYWVGHKNFYVITRYNHSEKYAMAVYQLAQEIAKARK